jgi:hypothetical protein
VSFDYLANLRKLKKIFLMDGLINEKPDQGVRERKKVGIH